MKKKKASRYPDYDLVEIPSHMLDSVWVHKTEGTLKLVFATGPILNQVKNNEMHLSQKIN